MYDTCIMDVIMIVNSIDISMSRSSPFHDVSGTVSVAAQLPLVVALHSSKGDSDTLIVHIMLTSRSLQEQRTWT